MTFWVAVVEILSLKVWWTELKTSRAYIFGLCSAIDYMLSVEIRIPGRDGKSKEIYLCGERMNFRVVINREKGRCQTRKKKFTGSIFSKSEGRFRIPVDISLAVPELVRVSLSASSLYLRANKYMGNTDGE